VVTGTVSSGAVSRDLEKAASSSATIIVLMGLSHLAEIADLVSTLRGDHEPMAVIQHATLPTQRAVVGTSKNIYQLAKDENIGSPAIIIIGKVVDLNTVPQSQPEIFEKIYAGRRTI